MRVWILLKLSQQTTIAHLGVGAKEKLELKDVFNVGDATFGVVARIGVTFATFAIVGVTKRLERGVREGVPDASIGSN